MRRQTTIINLFSLIAIEIINNASYAIQVNCPLQKSVGHNYGHPTSLAF